ncbi:MAG: hypothetical protein CMB64_03985 [Euryarchaeota archaeon]|nr:hypothetical protein [Euryarchaeota archaeon]
MWHWRMLQAILLFLMSFLSYAQPAGRLIVKNETIYNEAENKTSTYEHWSFVVTEYEDDIIDVSFSKKGLIYLPTLFFCST